MSLAREAAATAHRVDSHVYIGGYLAAADADYVRREGFARILKLFADTPEYPGGRHRHPGVTYKVVEAEDRADYPLDVHFADCLEFIQDGIRRGEKTLVHCHAGVSRSGTIVLLHLMVNRGLDLDRALSLLRGRRPVVNPNPGFWLMLRGVEARALALRARGAVPAAAYPA